MVLAPKLGRFARDYPDVVLDVTTTNEGRFDLVAGHFDAGIHLGEFIERDMIAVRVSPDQRAAIAGSPSYFAAHARPKSPRDLTGHTCLNFRHGSAGLYRWEFDKGRQSLAVAVNGPLIVDDAEILIRAAVDPRSRLSSTPFVCSRSRRRKRVALVVLLRGVNVGGHRTFRPAALARQLKHLDAVNIGAAGTFVIRRPVTRAQLRAELARRLPFDTAIMITAIAKVLQAR